MDKLYHVTLVVHGGQFGDEPEEKFFQDVVSIEITPHNWFVIKQSDGSEHGCHMNTIARYTKKAIQQ